MEGDDEEDRDESDDSEGTSDEEKCKDLTLSGIDDDGAPDIVTEMNFSDLESDEDVDDYGDVSE